MWGNNWWTVLRIKIRERKRERQRVLLNWPAKTSGSGEGSYRGFSAGWSARRKRKRKNAMSHKSTNRQAEQIQYKQHLILYSHIVPSPSIYLFSTLYQSDALRLTNERTNERTKERMGIYNVKFILTYCKIAQWLCLNCRKGYGRK